jgi:hypothetical protein
VEALLGKFVWESNISKLFKARLSPNYNYYQSFSLPTDAQKSCFKRILRSTLKQLLHVSVKSPSSGSVLFELAKVIVIKIIS